MHTCPVCSDICYAAQMIQIVTAMETLEVTAGLLDMLCRADDTDYTAVLQDRQQVQPETPQYPARVVALHV